MATLATGKLKYEGTPKFLPLYVTLVIYQEIFFEALKTQLNSKREMGGTFPIRLTKCGTALIEIKRKNRHTTAGVR